MLSQRNRRGSPVEILPEERAACAFVHLCRGRCAYRTVISSRSSVVAYRGARWGLREPCGMVDPARSALSCGVWCVWVAYSQCRSGYATRFYRLKRIVTTRLGKVVEQPNSRITPSSTKIRRVASETQLQTNPYINLAEG